MVRVHPRLPTFARFSRGRLSAVAGGVTLRSMDERTVWQATLLLHSARLHPAASSRCLRSPSRFRTARRARLTPARPSWRSRRDISPRLAEAALAAFVDDRLVDLTYPLTDGRAGSRSSPTRPRGARALSPFDGAPAGGRGDGAVPEGASAASARRSTTASSTTSSSNARSCPRTSSASKRRCASWRRRTCSTSGRCGRAQEAIAFFAHAASRSRCS